MTSLALPGGRCFLFRRSVSRLWQRQRTTTVNDETDTNSKSSATSIGDSDLPLSHVSAAGRLQMVDVSEKRASLRRAVASASVNMPVSTLNKLCNSGLAKSSCQELMVAAQLAGIQAAKQTALLLPLCHTLPLTHVQVKVWPCEQSSSVKVRAEVTCVGNTGVEMEALTAAAIASLTVYDTCKSAGHVGLVISQVRLEEKSGGKSGTYTRAELD